MSDPIRFFCIRGFMKSGTNWMCRLLNQHPLVHCVGEFHWESFFHAAQSNVNRIAPKRRQQLEKTLQNQLQQMVRSSLIELSGQSSGLIGDRTPTTIAPIVLHVPHIVMVRDFRDVMVSRMFHLFNNPRVTGIFDRDPIMAQRLKHFQTDCWYFQKNPEQLLDCEETVCNSAADWSRHMQADRDTVIEHPDLPVLFVKYEALHSNFKTELAKVFEFLELQMPATIPDRLTPGHDVENPSSLNRKGQVGDWKNYANDRALDWFKECAGKELRHLGYLI